MLFVDLGAAQRALDRPAAVSLVEVAALCTACPIEQMVAQIQAALPQARNTPSIQDAFFPIGGWMLRRKRIQILS